MSVVQVTGLPNTVKMPKLVYTFRDILKLVNVSKFWIKEIADMRNCDLKEAKIEFLSLEDARRAKKKLDGYIFYQGKVGTHLLAKFASEDYRHGRSPSPRRNSNRNYNRGWSREYYDDSSQRSSRFTRDRSRSPVYNESSKLDLEIELLRKQRMVIEEERRLLLERKKLELIKEYGPSASREFEHMERSRDRRQRPRKEERAAPPASPPRQRPRLARPGSLPQFILPCKLIMAQMKSIILKKTKEGEKPDLDKLIRTQLRRRIAGILKEKDYMTAEKIVELYRKNYPKSSDEQMVTTALKNLRLSLWLPQNESEQEIEPPKDIKEKTESDADTSDLVVKDDITEDVTVPPQVQKEEVKTLETDQNSKEDATIVETMEEVTIVEPKDEVNIAESNDEVTIEEENQEVTIEESKGEVTIVESKEEVTIIEPKEAVTTLVPDEEPENTKSDVVDEIDPGEITMELTVDGPDDDWIENGVAWNDDEKDFAENQD